MLVPNIVRGRSRDVMSHIPYSQERKPGAKLTHFCGANHVGYLATIIMGQCDGYMHANHTEIIHPLHRPHELY